ncbi:TPM domain-containing protein [Pandoraea pnomenusa]|uniref:TPM domain-containing protein n=1 Tax=Pandoraea pnomenusa TaxID=93220 RepID=UPI00333E42D1
MTHDTSSTTSEPHRTPHEARHEQAHDVSRWLRHFGTWRAHARWIFPDRALDTLEAAIRASEAEHRCEIRLVIEAAMPLAAVWHGQSCRQRAVHLFRQLGVTHTSERTGILLYINLADHDIELVADKGVNALVPTHRWDAVVTQMSAGFRDERYVPSVLEALDTLRGIARESLPAHAGAAPANALTDRPLML